VSGRTNSATQNMPRVEHLVVPKPDGTGFLVTSGRSGRVYELPLAGRFHVTCPCDAARHGRTGCSHVRAVYAWAERVLGGRR
jgi:hypothetical protein